MAAKLQQITELSTLLSDKKSICNDFLRLLDSFRIGKSLNKLQMEKQKGVSSLLLLKCLVIIRVCGLSIYQSYKQRFGGIIDGGKNQFYRFLERSNMNWRLLLINIAKSFKRIVIEQADKANFLYAIMDDTTIEKTGGSIEGISKVFDHTSHSYKLGFKMLTLAISDGKSTIPFDFSLHSEKRKDHSGGLTTKQLRHRKTHKRADDEVGKKRKAELKQKKTDIAIQMIKRLFRHGFCPSYLLVDKWFCNYSFIYALRMIANGAIHIISLLRDKRTYFEVNGKRTSAQSLCKEHDYNLHSCRQYKCRYYKVDARLNGLDVILFLVRYGNHGYEVIITTDTTLNFRQALEHYQHRWAIEVMFKECKQYLDLGGCQSTNFNSQVADCTLVLIGYTIIALKKRFSDYEVYGELFRELQREFWQLTLVERLLPFAMQLLDFMLSLCDITWSDFMQRLMRCEDTQNTFILFLKTINKSKNT